MIAQKRDRAIRNFIDRFELLPNCIVQPQFLPNATRSAATHVTTRLCQQDWLSSHKLIGATKYFRLGPRSLRHYPHRTKKATESLPPSRIPVELGALFYCLAADTPRLTPQELKAAFPEFPSKLTRTHPYCIDIDEETKRLAMLRIELSTSPEYIVKKHRKAIRKYNSEYRGFRRLYDRNELMIVAIAPSEPILTALADLIRRESWYPPCRLFHCPDLIHFT